MSLESRYKRKLLDRIEDLFPGCKIFKLDTSWQTGSPDVLILWNKHWAVLEVKRSANEKKQPNQEYFVEELDEMSFSAIIYPENEEEVLDALQSAFRPRRSSRLSQR